MAQLDQIQSTPHAGTSFSNVQEQFITYKFIKDNFTYDKALDIACGEGYGAQLLSTSGTVYALDLSVPALITMRNRYVKSSIKAICMNADSLGFADASFDLVIASHIIEHFDETQREFFLYELTRTLQKGGTAVIATPKSPKGIYIQKDGYHKILYDEPGFHRILGSHFESVEIYGVEAKAFFPFIRPVLRFSKQMLRATGILNSKRVQNTIAKTSTSSTYMNFKVTKYNDKARHLIAVCNKPLALKKNR